MKVISVLIFLLFLFAVLLTNSLLGQGVSTLRGSLRVVVNDSQEKVIPGASCLLTQNRRVVEGSHTDLTGTVVFGGLAAGLYELTVEKSGFATYKNKDIGIEADKPNELVVVLQVSSVSAEVSVENSSENVNTVEAGSSPPAGDVLRTTLERLPLATKRVDEAIPLIPGVIRSTTGEISIDGANEPQSSFRVNGLNVADPVSGNFRLNLPIDAVETVQVFRHPFSTEFGQFTGGVTNIETRRGGDKWHFEFNDFLPDFRFRNGSIHGVQDNSPHLNFNGPIIKNRFFLSQTLGYSISKSPVRGLSFPNNETISETQSSFTQLDWTLTPTHSQTFTFGYFPERQSFVGLDFFRPRPVTPNYKQKDFVGTFRDAFVFDNRALLQTSVSYKKFDADVWGQGRGEQNLTPVGETGNYFATQKRKSTRFEFLETYDFPAVKLFYGTHNIKTGFNYSRVTNKMDYSARPFNVIRGNGSLAERTTFETSPQFLINNRTFTGFVQDRWVLRPNFSVDLGVRIEDQRIASERSFAPRVGFAWSPRSDDKTVVRGGIGFFHDKVPLNIRAFGNYPARTVTTFGLDGQTIISRIRYESILVNNPSLIPLDFQTARSDVGFVPENLTWNMQVDQIINSKISLRASYTHSRTDRLYIVQPQTDFFGRSAIVLTPSGRSSYDAFELSAKFTLPRKQPFYVSYVRSKARGDLNDFNSFFNNFGVPLIRPNQYSNLSTDVPNRFLAWGNIALPYKITISPILEWRSGFPYSVVDQNQNFVGTRNASNLRFPPFFALDGEISKDFQVTKKYAVRLSLKGFNLTDHFNPRNVRNNLTDPQFGNFINSYRRYFTGGFDIIF